MLGEKQITSPISHMQQSGRAEFKYRPALPTEAPAGQCPPSPRHRLGPQSFGEFLTSDNNLSLILRRLDEIERKLDRMLEELRTPTAIGYSARRGSFPRKD